MMIRLNEYQFKEEYTYYILQSLKEGKKENFRRDFLNMHSMDQVNLFMELDETKRLRAYSFLSPAEFGHIFAELHPLQQKNTFWSSIISML
ncbi:hypothetical protein [Paenibacillus sp. OSY-SE]|uniref:hypothetical protein n=1 Tax=Paenibacillus sp. OSY-SE TaxID=1196323 RepID=UPI0002EFC695|nr:hypothetical protein [Paenibacillus sp. OSY-SE]